MTAPLVEPQAAPTAEDPAHLVCCEDVEYPFALCGTDVREDTLVRDTDEPICSDCERRDAFSCDQVCPRLTFGEVSS